MAHVRSKNAAGDYVLSVTGIISSCMPGGMGGLGHWYYHNGFRDQKLGLDPNHNRTLKEAAGSGTCAHGMVEYHTTGKPWDTDRELYSDECWDAATLGFQGFLEWFSATKIEIQETEVTMVSEAHQYSGTLDAIGSMPDGKVVLIDYKTSKSFRTSAIYQVAAYGTLWDETHDTNFIDLYYMLRFGKEYGEFAFHSIPVKVIHRAWEGFKAMQQLNAIDKELKKVTG